MDAAPVGGMTPHSRLSRRRVAGVLLALVSVAACSSDGTTPTRAASVSLSVTATVEGAVGPDAAARGPEHTLHIDRVGLVVAELALSGVDGDESLEAGPFLLDLPLDGTVRSLVAATVPPGRYEAMQLQLWPLNASEPDDHGLLLVHPDVEGLSVRVEGRWNGEPFVYGRALDAVRRLELHPPVEVRGRTANVTLMLDVGSWFRRDDGTLVNPADAGEGSPAGASVEARIHASFQAFEDADADGVAGG